MPTATLPPSTRCTRGITAFTPARAPWLACALALAAPVLAQPAAEMWEHRISPRDTLLGLHASLLRPDADWRVVQRLNGIKDPRRLQPGSMLRIPVSMLREEAAPAEVLHVHGEVFFTRGGVREALRAATELRTGDLVETGAQSSVSIRFSDGSRTLLGPGSRLRLERQLKLGASGAVDTQLRLDSGSAENRVPPARATGAAPRFQLRTPVANLGVRGTDFRARVDGERTLAEVLEGRVAVGAVSLDAGFGTVATAGQVAAPRALPAPPDLGQLPALVERLPLQFVLQSSGGGAARHRAQVFAAGDGTRLLLDGLFEGGRIAWPDSPEDGRYELRVRAAEASGIEGRAANWAFTLKARPEPPFQLRPRAAERLLEARVDFAWSAHPQATRYRLQVAPRSDFAPPLLVDRSDLTATELTVPVPVGTWYWRLATVRGDNDAGPWGDPVELVRTDPPPPPPPAAPPVQPPQPPAAGLMMRWAAAPLPGVRYQVQVARDAAFTDFVLDETTSDTERLFPSPGPGTYHLRVRTVTSDGRAGSFGAAQVIEVPRSWGWLLWLLPLLLLL